MIGKYLGLGLAAALVSIVPAVAQGTDDSKSKARNPNEVVCEKSGVLGSRLASKKTCMTRAEWAEQKRVERLELDKVQRGRGSCEGCN